MIFQMTGVLKRRLPVVETTPPFKRKLPKNIEQRVYSNQQMYLIFNREWTYENRQKKKKSLKVLESRQSPIKLNDSISQIFLEKTSSRKLTNFFGTNWYFLLSLFCCWSSSLPNFKPADKKFLFTTKKIHRRIFSILDWKRKPINLQRVHWTFD